MTILALQSFISQSSTKTRAHRILSAQFGDGYRQTAPDGINNRIDTWSINYENLSTADRDTLWVFLDLVGAFDTFTWQAFGDAATKTWRITGDISESYNSGGIYSVSFRAEQVY